MNPNVTELKKKIVMTPKGLAYMGTALAMRTDVGEVVIVCPDELSASLIYDKLNPENGPSMNFSALMKVAVIKASDTTELRGQ